MKRESTAALIGACLCALAAALHAQQPTGSIAGIVMDPSGGVIPGVAVEATNQASQARTNSRTTAAGAFTVASLLPGTYKVKVENQGFKTAFVEVTVEVGRVTPIEIRLEVGRVTEIVRVEAHLVAVNPVQTSLEGLVTTDLIRNLPLNGRNFLDLGQLEPGVQLQDGGNFDPTKGQYVGLSINASSGRTTRVTLDGVDVSDEAVGTTTLNISQDAIQEFQISRSSLDVSTDLSDMGAVNVVTKSGSNEVHGDAFFFMRSDAWAARIGQESAPFDREQIGFDAGGPFVRDKLFWFANYERNNQDASVATNIPAFPQYTNTWAVPSDERLVTLRTDWNVTPGLRIFLRFSHNWNNAVASGGAGLGGTNLSPFANQDNTNQTAAGLDLSNGRSVHSFRYGYLDFNNHITDARRQVSGLPLTLDPDGRDVMFCFIGPLGVPLVGPNWLAPQRTLQDNHQFRYDGALAFGRHSVRWGANINLVRMNAFAALFGNGPEIDLLVTGATRQEVEAAGLDPLDPLNYPVLDAVIANGLGWFSEIPTLGFPFGGFKNNRIHWYLADTWRPSPRLTLNYGLRYVYEPGQNNHDLAKPALLEEFMPGLSRPTRRDKNNFAPHLGIAWNLTGGGKWVLRAGAGFFYAPNIAGNLIHERSDFIPPGIGYQVASPPIVPVQDPRTNETIWDGTCCGGQSISGLPANTPGLIDAVLTASDAFKAAASAATASFPSGPTTFERTLHTGYLYDPSFSTSYSFHFNAGIQRELRPGLVLSVDYLYQRGVHSPLGRDFNRLGAADTLSVPNAVAVMDGLHDALGCPPGPDGVDCAIAAGVTISDYGAFGLGACEWASPGSPNPCAFPGMNPNFNVVGILGMQGKSRYNALQVQVRGALPDLGKAMKHWNIVASYSLSRYSATSYDTGFYRNLAWNNDNVQEFYGPETLDRTHMLSVASLFTAPLGVRLNSIWHVNSAFPGSVFVPGGSGGPEEIFLSDFNGDGTTWDALPGTNRGSFGRSIPSPGELNQVISSFNNNLVGKFTPAAQALIDAGLFTPTQLVALGAVVNGGNPLPSAPADQVMLDSFITTDLRISRPFKFWRERITVEPALEVFNLFNVANYDLPGNTLTGLLSGEAGSINGTTRANRPNRAGFGSGSFAQGIPRAWQFALRISF
ncbi:MAG: carboxypeptidase regulatory-like domain-containing protein [Acidobacteriia bacterium]|nr:carboxypeptidase regulatory-like domain-containing protein [Terriglobia bacterium]